MSLNSVNASSNVSPSVCVTNFKTAVMVQVFRKTSRRWSAKVHRCSCKEFFTDFIDFAKKEFSLNVIRVGPKNFVRVNLLSSAKKPNVYSGTFLSDLQGCVTFPLFGSRIVFKRPLQSHPQTQPALTEIDKCFTGRNGMTAAWDNSGGACRKKKNQKTLTSFSPERIVFWQSFTHPVLALVCCFSASSLKKVATDSDVGPKFIFTCSLLLTW